MPRRKTNTPKQRLNTTVKPNTIKMLDAMCKETGLDRGQMLDSLIMHAFDGMGLVLADIPPTPDP